MQLETKIALNEAEEIENVASGDVFSIEEKKKFLLAAVISRPPFTPYDMLIIDFGLKEHLHSF